MSARLRIDVSKMYSYPVLQSRAAVKSHKELSRSITGHKLAWRKGQINTRFFHHDLDQISLMLLGYGAEVEIHAAKFQDFSLVQIPLQGVTEIISDGTSVVASSGETVIVTPTNSVHTLWQAGCEQLLVKIPHRLIANLASGHKSSDPDLKNMLCSLQPAYKINHKRSTQWQQLLQQLLTLPTLCHKSPYGSLWLRHFETNIALFLLGHQHFLDNKDEAGHSPVICANDKVNLPKRGLVQIEQYVRAHPEKKLLLADLANIAGVSLRVLHGLCHDHVGVSPMVWLRHIRLDAARKKIQTHPKTSITEIALTHGFEHLGRFSSYYHKRFGELPRATRSS